MCRPVTCKRCGGTTWAGCGMHVADVMNAVPTSSRCRCGEDGAALRQGLLSFLSRRR